MEKGTFQEEKKTLQWKNSSFITETALLTAGDKSQCWGHFEGWGALAHQLCSLEFPMQYFVCSTSNTI